jgi:hypothetical protein
MSLHRFQIVWRGTLLGVLLHLPEVDSGVEKVGVESGNVQLARRRELDGVVECGGVVDGSGSEASR